MKKKQARQKPHKQRKKKLQKSLIIKLTNGSQYDFFKLPNDMRMKLIAEVPELREKLAEFKA